MNVVRHDVFLKVLDELPLKHSISDIIPGGPSVVEILCGELAYGSGAYAIQTTLRQISRTEWGHRELVRLAVRPPSEENRYKNLIVDCVTKLLRLAGLMLNWRIFLGMIFSFPPSFENGFSCAMAFRIFGRLACCNQEVYILLGGSKGVAWLVRCLDEQTFGYHNRVGGAGNKKIEIYCNALMAACTQGFVDCVIQHNIVPLLLRVMEMLYVPFLFLGLIDFCSLDISAPSETKLCIARLQITYKKIWTLKLIKSHVANWLYFCWRIR